MKLHTILLVACLTTVPAVAAEGPGCETTDYGASCGGSVPYNSPIQPDSETRAREECKPLAFVIQTRYFPVDVDPRPECIVEI